MRTALRAKQKEKAIRAHADLRVCMAMLVKHGSYVALQQSEDSRAAGFEALVALRFLAGLPGLDWNTCFGDFQA